MKSVKEQIEKELKRRGYSPAFKFEQFDGAVQVTCHVKVEETRFYTDKTGGAKSYTVDVTKFPKVWTASDQHKTWDAFKKLRVERAWVAPLALLNPAPCYFTTDFPMA